MTEDHQIKCINFGNYWLDKWIENEEVAKQSIINSRPLRFCLDDVYKALVELGELPVFWKSKKESERIKDALLKSFEWHPTEDDLLLEGIAKCILVLEVMADKRLKVTTG